MSQRGNSARAQTRGLHVTAWKPPRGIRYKSVPRRPTKPYQLLWQENGRVRSQVFADPRAREEAAKALAGKLAGYGTEILAFDPKEWRVWQMFKERTGGADPLLVAHEWLASRQARGLSAGGITIAAAVARYVIARKEEKLTADTYRHIDTHLVKRLVPIYGARPLTDLTADEIRSWLGSVRGSRGSGELGPIARRHHQKNLKTFLDYCVREAWIARNPAELLGLPKVLEDDPELLSVGEARKLFDVNANARVVGRLALEAFGGQRYSTAARIQRDDIKTAEKGIRMRAGIHKSQKTKYRQGYPENLWAWLAAAPASCWEMTPLEYRNEKRDAFVRAGLGPSANRLRKTFASAHLALFKNQPLTSYLMQHSNTATTDIYVGVMTEADGRAYFAIQP
ncbi:MAG TPA: hypothetical protein VFE31_08650 [Opitutaceae bacterium]|jgi:site-specific recombinase XerD|nr:hypothetical protein [Opitutaceae bacterium]